MRNRSSEAGGIIAGLLSAFLVLIGLAIIGVIAAALFLKNLRVTTTGDDRVRVDTPVGTLRVKGHARLDPRALGVPIYPGAVREQVDGGSASVELDWDSRHTELALVAADYSTDDAADQVIDFYKRELPHWMVSHSHKHGFQMELTDRGYRRFIAISEREGRTHIALASLGKPAAN